jgi:hypothetical protein
MIPVKIPDDTPTILVMYKTEISTFFYVFKLMIQQMKYKNRIVTQINDLLFFITFFKFRIYDYYNILISDRSTYIDYMKYNYSYVILGAIHGMYILNVYWFLIICKIAFKPLVKSFSQKSSEYICHYITSYTQFVSLLISIYIYTYEWNDRYWYNIIGTAIISMTSYYYHSYAYKLIDMSKDICYTSSDTIGLFLRDIGAIHLNSFLALLTNYDWNNIVYFSLFLHIAFYMTNIIHIYYSKYTKTIIYGNNVHYSVFVSFQYYCIFLPNGIDVILIIFNSLGTVYSIHGIYISLFLMLLFITNPLYDLTHVALHLSIIFQTYCSAQCNIYSIKMN